MTAPKKARPSAKRCERLARATDLSPKVWVKPPSYSGGDWEARVYKLRGSRRLRRSVAICLHGYGSDRTRALAELELAIKTYGVGYREARKAMDIELLKAVGVRSPRAGKATKGGAR